MKRFREQVTPDPTGYAETADRMVELAEQQPGFIGIESVRDESGFGITVSYWETDEAIRAWKVNAEHLEAQKRGREDWYANFNLRICRVDRECSGGVHRE